MRIVILAVSFSYGDAAIVLEQVSTLPLMLHPTSSTLADDINSPPYFATSVSEKPYSV